jgi:hypothetical protein
LALSALLDAAVPSALKSVATACTVVCNWPRRLSFERTVASRFWSAVIGIVAIATARFNTLCKSLEYWPTPVSVTGAKTDVEAVGMEVVDGVLVLMLGLDGSHRQKRRKFE